MSDYWGSDAGRYLVTIIPFAPPGPGATSIGGTGRGDAFAFFATTNALPEMLDRLMAHEMAHSWVNVRIGVAGGGAGREDADRPQRRRGRRQAQGGRP